MPDLSTEICSAAVMIYCTATGFSAKGAIVESTFNAYNYRGKILGGMLLQLILRAASQDRSVEYQPVVIHCDNKGVVNHGNSLAALLGRNSPRQTSFAASRTMCRLIHSTQISGGFHRIKISTRSGTTVL